MAGARFEFRPADFDQDRRASRVAGDGTGSPVARHTTSTKHAAAVAATSSTSIRVKPAITKVTNAGSAVSLPIELHSAGIHERWLVYSQRDGTSTWMVGMVGNWQELTLRSVLGLARNSLSCVMQCTLHFYTEMFLHRNDPALKLRQIVAHSVQLAPARSCTSPLLHMWGE